MGIELFCLKNLYLFGRRHPRYWLIAVFLLQASLPHWRRRRVLRTGFCFLQIVDDLLDGDRPSSREPLEVVDELAEAIRREEYGSGALMRLAEAFSRDLRQTAGQGAVDDALELMAVMQEDRRRAMKQARWNENRLRAHHRRTFELSVDLMLQAGGAELRAEDVPELIEAFGWCSVMRDLQEDLEGGRINIPEEIWKDSSSTLWGGRSMTEASRPEGWLADPAVRRWMHRERTRALAHLDATDRRLDTLRGKAGAGVLRLFARSIRGFAEKRYRRLYPLEK